MLFIALQDVIAQNKAEPSNPVNYTAPFAQRLLYSYIMF